MTRSPSQTSLVFVVLAALACPYTLTAVRAQEATSPRPSASLERLRTGLQERQPPPLTVDPMVAKAPDEWRLGILTFEPPRTKGEFVRVRVPVGALVSGVARSIVNTQRRRAEKAAREDVAKALEEFLKAQAP